MKQEVVMVLSDEEINEITDLYEKKLALENLVKIVDINNKELYTKLIGDYGKCTASFENWWVKMSTIYHWEGSKWSVDFENKRVLLVE